MAEYIECRNCDSHDCKGCNLKNLETMLKNGKFDCLMNENRYINTAADVAPVRHGRWITTSGEVFPGSSQFLCYSHKHDECGFQYVGLNENEYDYCPKCGAKMDGGAD